MTPDKLPKSECPKRPADLPEFYISGLFSGKWSSHHPWSRPTETGHRLKLSARIAESFGVSLSAARFSREKGLFSQENAFQE
jgi:hypothetical protein